MSNWNTYKLGELCTKVTSGGTPLRSKKEFYENGTIPWLKTKEVANCRVYDAENKITQLGLEKSSAKLIPANSVIVAMYGDGETAGRVAINKVPLATNQACCNLIVDASKADYEFIYYYLLNSYEYLVNLKSGSGQQNLSGAIIKEVEVILPDLPTQRRIAELLSTLDDKIELNRRMNQTLEQMAQTLFRQYFVDGIDEENLPEGWGECKYGDVLEFVVDNRGKTPPTSEKGFPMVEGWQIFCEKSFMDFTNTGKQKYVSEQIYKTRFRAGHPKYLDILCATVGTLPKWCFAPRDQEICVAQNVVAFRANDNLVSPYYLKCLMDTTEFINDFNSRIVTTAQPSIKLGPLKEIEILLPDRETIRKFDLQVEPIFTLIEERTKEIRTITNLRDTLLPKLMSGEIDVMQIKPEEPHEPVLS